MISSHFFAPESVFRLRSSVTRHATRPDVWSRYPYNASRIAFGSLRASTFSNPILTRASISVTRNSTHRDRIPFRRRSRCRRMRSAADERAIVSAGTVMISLRFVPVTGRRYPFWRRACIDIAIEKGVQAALRLSRAHRLHHRLVNARDPARERINNNATFSLLEKLGHGPGKRPRSKGCVMRVTEDRNRKTESRDLIGFRD